MIGKRATLEAIILWWFQHARLFQNLREDKAYTYGSYSSVNQSRDAELDRFCDAMISIREEIKNATKEDDNNPLKNAPHTQEMLTADAWEFPYTRKQAAFPLAYIADNKFWPTVRRVDDAFGDRNLICSCNPIEDYM